MKRHVHLLIASSLTAALWVSPALAATDANLGGYGYTVSMPRIYDQIGFVDTTVNTTPYYADQYAIGVPRITTEGGSNCCSGIGDVPQPYPVPGRMK